MNSITKQVRNLLGRLNVSPRPTPVDIDAFRETPVPRMRIETDTMLNIRLYKVENGWVVQSYHENKNNTMGSTRVVADDADVMKEIEASVAIFKIG